MIFEQHYLDCLSQASYLVGDESTGRAVVVDPRRDVSAYLDSAREHGVTIELVIETHFHADFLSGHLELAEATGATICYGPGAETEFPSRNLADGERISLGQVTLDVLHTPGHTPESISIVVRETPDAEPYGVLTGDTLFIGDVGRPDLLSSAGLSAAELGGMLYDSLRAKLMPLPGATRVYPAHGAGSACGRSLSTDTWSTMADQLTTNYALAPMSRDDFVAAVTEGQTAPPQYFSYDAHRNRERHDLLDEEHPPPALPVDDVLVAQRDGAVVLDTRDADVFAAGHLAGSVNVGLDGRYAEYVGGVVQPGAPIILVTEPDRELEAKVRLGRIGFDTVIGHVDDLADVLTNRPDLLRTSSRLTALQLRDALEGVEGLQLVDVRQPGETALGTIEGAILVPLTRLNELVGRLDARRPTVVYCAGGYRSSIAASRMAAGGFVDVSDLRGGYGAWLATSPGALV